MIDFNLLLSAELINLDFDKDSFIKEYDNHILPHSNNIRNGQHVLFKTVNANSNWGMVEPQKYLKADVRTETGADVDNGYPSWKGTSLIYLDTTDEELKENSKNGSVSIRNYVLDKQGEFKFFPQYENLNITKYIKSLPLHTIIGIRCVSLQPDTFSIIHRDDTNYLPDSQRSLKVQRMVDNYLWKQGFVQITINISDGEVPLYYSITSDLSEKFKTINYSVYLFNDFFYHGVPITKSRRRQIRITGRPTNDLMKHINNSTLVYYEKN